MNNDNENKPKPSRDPGPLIMKKPKPSRDPGKPKFITSEGMARALFVSLRQMEIQEVGVSSICM